MRLLLVRHAPTASTRSGRFPSDEPLDAGGLEDARSFGARIPSGATRWLSSPSARALQTARAAGLQPGIDADLSECDFGSWAGMTFREVREADPDGLQSFLNDPGAAPHGGESLTGFLERISGFMRRTAPQGGGTLAVTHAGFIRAAVLAALRAPADAFWSIEAAPLSVTELASSDEGWRVVRVNA